MVEEPLPYLGILLAIIIATQAIINRGHSERETPETPGADRHPPATDRQGQTIREFRSDEYQR